MTVAAFVARYRVGYAAASGFPGFGARAEPPPVSRRHHCVGPVCLECGAFLVRGMTPAEEAGRRVFGDPVLPVFIVEP